MLDDRRSRLGYPIHSTFWRGASVRREHRQCATAAAYIRQQWSAIHVTPTSPLISRPFSEGGRHGRRNIHSWDTQSDRDSSQGHEPDNAQWDYDSIPGRAPDGTLWDGGSIQRRAAAHGGGDGDYHYR